MQEAYELADRNDAEGYNAVKVMCGDVQKMLSPKRKWVGLTKDDIDLVWPSPAGTNSVYLVARVIEAKLKEKNT